MGVSSGTLQSIVIAGRRFTVDAESGGKVTLSGFSNEVKPNADGTNRIVKTRHPGKIEDCDLIADNDRDDLEFLQESQDSLEFLDISATEIDGTVLGGNMQITDEIALELEDGKIPIALVGDLKKIG